MRPQTTVARPVRVSGVALHSGRHVETVLSPAPPNHGIAFWRQDAEALVPALVEQAGRFDHATSLGAPGREMATVEHLLSAAFGIGLDNLLVDVSEGELPILDGSAAPWLALFREAGLVRQGVPVRPFVPSRPVQVVGGPGRRIEIRPASDLRITYTIAFPNAVVGRQSITVVITPESYARHLAPARTFGFLSEYETMKVHGLARGASPSNCIVVGPDRVENGVLRFPDEFVRHKALDLLGDLALLGRPLLGHIVAHRAGHSLHASLVRRLRDEMLAAPQAEDAGVALRSR